MDILTIEFLEWSTCSLDFDRETFDLITGSYYRTNQRRVLDTLKMCLYNVIF